METNGTNNNTKTCECGCGEAVRRTFLPGHDAKLKGRLIREATAPEWWVREAAITSLLERGWGHFVPKGAVEMGVPTRSRHNGQMHETRHINDVHEWHTDEAGFGHAFWTCRAVEGEITHRGETGGFACSTCVHTHDINERVAMAQRDAWVAEAPTEDTGDIEWSAEIAA